MLNAARRLFAQTVPLIPSVDGVPSPNNVFQVLLLDPPAQFVEERIHGDSTQLNALIVLPFKDVVVVLKNLIVNGAPTLKIPSKVDFVFPLDLFAALLVTLVLALIMLDVMIVNLKAAVFGVTEIKFVLNAITFPQKLKTVLSLKPALALKQRVVSNVKLKMDVDIVLLINLATH